MQEKDRKVARQRLDVEMRPYRQAARNKDATPELLKTTRQVLNIPLGEIAGKLGVAISTVTDREERERGGTITLRAMSQMARAMGCRMVYGIVPARGRTLEELAEERVWAKVLEMQRVSESAGQRVGELAS